MEMEGKNWHSLSSPYHVQSCAEKRNCLAKHQPGVAGCGWLKPGRNLLSTYLRFFCSTLYSILSEMYSSCARLYFPHAHVIDLKSIRLNCPARWSVRHWTLRWLSSPYRPEKEEDSLRLHRRHCSSRRTPRRRGPTTPPLKAVIFAFDYLKSTSSNRGDAVTHHQKCPYISA